jgi:DNA-binding GntR family transcriptional regulator
VAVQSGDISQAERAYTTLRDRIVTLELPPGALLSEEALARELGFGRTPIREAIKRLSLERLVVVLPRRATLVAEIDSTSPRQVLEVRLVLERLAARLAAERATEADREQAEALIADLDGVDRDTRNGDLLDLDTRVRRLIHAMAKNPMLRETLDTYYNLSVRPWYARAGSMPQDSWQVARAHIPLLRAIVDGDADRAEKLASEGIERYAELLAAPTGSI